MDIGFMGLGKLGLPSALTIEDKGHSVIGYDPSPTVATIINTKKLTYKEEGAQELLEKSKIKIVSPDILVSASDIIFVPIQTPHDPRYEGITRIPKERVDFFYDFLVTGIETLSNEIEKQDKDKVVIIISTVLPGTIRTKILPIIGPNTKLCYNPFFIAMGTTIPDFLNPEFVLFGVHDQGASDLAEEFYRTIHDKPFYKTSIDNAELIKVAYNTYIGMKIAFVNTLMEICHKSYGCNVDSVTSALKLATDRLISTKYLDAGMGDGGGCHPRDNIALSWLSRKLNLSYDWFESVMMAREKQTEFLADLIEKHNLSGDTVYILGKSFKPETNIVTGSPSILLKNILEERGVSVIMYDHLIDDELPPFQTGTYFIGTKHAEFSIFPFPPGSTVIDPWGYVEESKEITLIKIGR
jgi:UDPglucose 6-dehydrogenase